VLLLQALCLCFKRKLQKTWKLNITPRFDGYFKNFALFADPLRSLRLSVSDYRKVRKEKTQKTQGSVPSSTFQKSIAKN
jgi:hypothetical protein